MAVALITGASSGIGRHTALELASRGHAVAVLARRAELLDSLVAEIESGGGRALALPCDVTDRAAVLAAAKQAEASLGPVEVLIGNAGGGAPTHVDEFQAAGTKPEYRYMRMLAHLPVALAASPERILVICFGTGTTSGSPIPRASCRSTSASS